MNSDNFRNFLKMVARNGFLEILTYINKNSNSRYGEIHRFAKSNKIVKSQASITIILNGLVDLGLVDRNVVNGKPPRTAYSINKMGRSVLRKLNNFKDSI